MSCETANDPALLTALARYDAIWDEWMSCLVAKGVKFEDFGASRVRCKKLRSRLKEQGASICNAGASVAIGTRSAACIECTGAGISYTYYISLACHRNCYYCFNSNQQDFDRYCKEDYPWEVDLGRLIDSGVKADCIGLTGGEPMLRIEQTLDFFARARAAFPEAHLRLYTSGDLLDAATLDRLAIAGLNEIRFSLKMEDPPERRNRVLVNIERACECIPSVMVEMPAIPGTELEMRIVLDRLEQTGVFGINLLEFCYPFHRWEEFERSGFLIAYPPFAVLYDYDYAGGLPVSGSEELCLNLALYVIERGMALNVHYCSLENKHRMELRHRNANTAFHNSCYVMDTEDFFVKTCTVYGREVESVRTALLASGCQDFIEDEGEASLSFPPSWCDEVLQMGAHPVYSYNILEEQAGDLVLREVEIEPAWMK